jgi:ABC-type amino acid transport substrate-binding protein
MGEIAEVKDWDKSENTVIHGLVLSKKFYDEDEYQKISDIIDEMKNDGTLKKIFSKYLSEEEVEEALKF